MSLSILAIDGGGVKGVIPLEFLLLVQEHLATCAIQDVVDLAIGTSSGMYPIVHRKEMIDITLTCDRRPYRAGVICYALGYAPMLSNF